MLIAVILLLAAGDTSHAQSIGEVGVLKPAGEGASMVLVGADEKAVDAFYKALVSKDKTGIQELIDAGQLFGVPVGAKVKVLDAHGFFGSTLEVRILEGRYKGRRGFVSSQLVAGKSDSSKNTPTPGLSPIFENDDN